MMAGRNVVHYQGTPIYNERVKIYSTEGMACRVCYLGCVHLWRSDELPCRNICMKPGARS